MGEGKGWRAFANRPDKCSLCILGSRKWRLLVAQQTQVTRFLFTQDLLSKGRDDIDLRS